MGSRRILTIGECMVEMAPREDGAYNRNFAGDTFNTAWYLRQLLGADDVVDYCSAIGVDGISQAMLDFMQAAGIGAGHLRRLEDATVGLYMIELANGERSFSYWRGQSAAKRLAEDRDFLKAAMRGRDLILFSGITLAILPRAGRQQLLEVLAQAREAGSLIAFDPNMRARLWPDRDSMCAAISAAAAVADIILPSFDEDGPNFNDATPEATIMRYRKAGAATVVVKNGAGRVYAFDATEGPATFDPVPVTDLADTTAAGDSFNAGFLSLRLSGATMEQALAQGAAVSAQVIRKRGALVDIESKQ